MYVKDPATFCCFTSGDEADDDNDELGSSSLFEDMTKSIYTSYLNGSALSSSSRSTTLSSSVLASSAASFDTQLNDTINNASSYENTNNYETDMNDKEKIRVSQEWPLHLFCFKLVSTLVDYLKLAPTCGHDSSYTELLSISCETLNHLVDILNETKQEWSHLNTSELLMDLFKKVNLNIKSSIKEQQRLG